MDRRVKLLLGVLVILVVILGIVFLFLPFLDIMEGASKVKGLENKSREANNSDVEDFLTNTKSFVNFESLEDFNIHTNSKDTWGIRTTLLNV